LRLAAEGASVVVNDTVAAEAAKNVVATSKCPTGMPS
jgi:hypothetical protein